jgi:PAS domain S-box-containing protein
MYVRADSGGAFAKGARVGAGERTPWFTTDERRGLAALWHVYREQQSAIAGQVMQRIRGVPEFAPALAAMSPQALADQADVFSRSIRNAVDGDFGPLEAALAERTVFYATFGATLRAWGDVAAICQQSFTVELIKAHGAEPDRLAEAFAALHRFASRSLTVIADEHLAIKERFFAVERQNAEKGLVKFNRVTASGLLGILVCDLVGNIREANDSFLAMVGYTREEVMSGIVRWADMTPPEWRHLDDAAVKQLQAGGTARPWEKEYLRKDGSRVPILVGVAMLNDEECVAFVLDITERKRLEEVRAKSSELEAQNRRIQEASRLKSEFLANMSHELRTPLNSIIGFADLLHDGEVPQGSPQHREFLADILKSGRHLLQLINDVLDLAKVEAGKIDFCPEPVDLARLAGEVTAVLRTVAATKNIRLEINIDPAAARASLDPGRLKQVLYNYVSNALKFTPDSGRVIIRTAPERGDMFRIEVEDTGIGITAQDISRLFVEFQQLDAGASKKHGGTGLGLALTKRIVEAQGGTVGVKSKVGQGSVFFAVLPVHADPGSPAEAPVPHERRVGAASVLVVEDDLRDRRLLVQTLSKAGYGVETAATGGEAIASCEARVFDAITLDLLLPDMTGLDVLHRVRVAGRNRDTPVVVVSIVAEQGVMGGFVVDDYLPKPINGTELLASLQRAAVSPEKDGVILVVDDDPAARRLMGATLEQLGYRIECTASGEEALTFVDQKSPIAIILDLVMPGIGGLEFLTRFRSSPKNQTTPVLIWTMKDLTNEDHRHLEELAQKVIAKGQWTPTSLVDDLRSLLLQRRQAREGEPR